MMRGCLGVLQSRVILYAWDKSGMRDCLADIILDHGSLDVFW